MPDEMQKARSGTMGFEYLEKFPDAASVFKHEQLSFAQARDSAIVVLDTNVLLLPYKVGNVEMSEIRRLYEELAVKERLFLPGHVAREFAVNRGQHLHEIRQKVRAGLNAPSQADLQVPFLDDLQEFKDLKSVAQEIKKLKQWAKLESACAALEKRIVEWCWEDPLSVLYRKLFNAKNVVDIDLTTDLKRQEFADAAAKRSANDVGPGLRDLNKTANSLGDQIIWRTLLLLAERMKTHLVFVTNDGKSDWVAHKLYPRFELLLEYSKASGGKCLYIMTLAEYLDRSGVRKAIVAEVSKKQEEQASTFQERVEEAAKSLIKMKDRAQLAYFENPAMTIDRLSLKLGPSELNGRYFSDAHYSVTTTTPSAWVAHCSGVFDSPPTSLVITVNLQSGQYQFNRYYGGAWEQ